MTRNKPFPAILSGIKIRTVLNYLFSSCPFIFVSTNNSAAQKLSDDIRLKGKVSSQGGEALQGATVRVKSKSLTSSTNVAGEVSIGVDPKAVLIVTYTGYKKQEVSVNKGTQINVVLEDSISNMEDIKVVSVGHGTLRKSDVTGAISKI